MLLSQIEFLLTFLPLLVFLLVVRSNRPRKVVLLAYSYYFYAYWDWRFLGLILFSTTVDYLVGQFLKHEGRDARRKALIVLSLCANLGLLGFFKYFNFFSRFASTHSRAVGPATRNPGRNPARGNLLLHLPEHQLQYRRLPPPDRTLR